MTGAGQVGQPQPRREPRGNHLGRELGIREMRKTEYDAREAEKDPGDAHRALIVEELDAQRITCPHQRGPKHPATNHEAQGLAEPLPRTYARDVRYDVDASHQHPDQLIGVHGDGQARRGSLEKQADPRRKEEGARSVSKAVGPGEPWWNSLPLQREVAVEEAQNAEPRDADGETDLSESPSTQVHLCHSRSIPGEASFTWVSEETSHRAVATCILRGPCARPTERTRRPEPSPAPPPQSTAVSSRLPPTSWSSSPDPISDGP